MIKSTLLLVAIAVAALRVSAFAPLRRFQGIVPSLSSSKGNANRQGILFYVEKPSNSESDFPQDNNEYTGSVDWDAEWKKVVEKEKLGKSGERPGKDFYKSEAEIAAIKAAKRAAKQASDVKTKFEEAAPKIDMGSLAGDWQFWIGILVVVSVGLSLLSAPPQGAMGGGDSYYI